MEIRGLRLGNIISFENSKVPSGRLNGVVEGIKVNYVEGVSLFNEVAYMGNFDYQIEGVLLTAEWLDRFGFVKDSSELYNYHKDSFTLEVFGISLPPEDRDYRFRAYGMETTVKYVHSLQNLYYALTGEELVLKEATAAEK